MADHSHVPGVVARASVLAELGAAQAEVWASGFAADADLAALGAVADIGGDNACGLLYALAAIIEAPADRIARNAAASLVQDGATPPDWVEVVGTATARSAWLLPGDGTATVIVEFAHVDESTHTMLIDISLTGIAAAGAHAGPRPDQPDTVRYVSDIRFGSGDLLESVAEDLLGTGTVPEVLEVADATALLADAALAPVADGVDIALNLVVANARLLSMGIASPLVLASDPDASSADGLDDIAPDDEDRAAAVAVLDAALGEPVHPPEVVATVARLLRPALVDPTAMRVDADTAADLRSLVVVAGLAGCNPDDVGDVELLARLAGAYIDPGDLSAHERDAAEAIATLEWADWLGAIIPLVRNGVGTVVTPESLVDNINRCAEITTTIPKRDRPLIAWAFGQTLYAWELTGIIDGAGRLTELGRWLLPAAVRVATKD